MITGGYAKRAVLLFLSLILLAACDPSPTTTPVAPLPTRTSTVAAAPLPTSTSAVAVPPSQTPTPELGPTATDTPATPTFAPLAGEALLAWTVAPDGAVYVLDSTQTLYQLSSTDLAPLAQSAPLLESDETAPAYLLASEEQVFVGSGIISQTLVLDRGDFNLAERLEGFGPMALEPGRRLFLIPQGLEEIWPFGNFEIWAYDLRDLGNPPDRVRYTGTSFDDLVVDAASRCLYALTSNIAASPPHQGQTYEIYSLDTLEQIARVDWERGSLTRPVVNPGTGELVGSRIGLNQTRRLLVADHGGTEVRSRPSVDGQPAIDAAGEWIYLLRQRGLWLLRAADLSLESVLPFSGPPPADLALSPDGQTLYLFGNGWLSALSTAELRQLGLAPVSQLPAAWFPSDHSEQYVQPRVYPSPQMDHDGVAFVQLVGGALNVLETYHSTDGGRSWVLLPALMEPDLESVMHFHA